MRKTIILLILLMACFTCAADLVMFAGGTGDQTGTPIPGVVTKTAWDAGNPSDFMDANGLPLVTLAAANVEYFAGGSRVSGDFSGVTVGTYIFLTRVTGNNPPYGYYKITDNGSGADCTIDNGYLAELGGIVEDGTSDVSVGGAANKGSVILSIENCDDYISSHIDAASYSVDVLFNKDETATGAVSMLANSTLTGRLRYVGTTYDGETADNCFQPIDETTANLIDEDDMPTINMAAYVFTLGSGGTTSLRVEYKHIKWTGINTTNVVYGNRSNGLLLRQCVINNTSTSSSSACAIYPKRTTLINCKISSMGTLATEGAVKTEYTNMQGCFIFANQCRGVDLNGSYDCGISNCIITAGESNTAAGVYISSLASTASSSCFSNCIIRNFKTGFHFDTLPDVADIHRICVFNNIIWGNNASGAYGIYNNGIATNKTCAYLFNNFIGNVDANESNWASYDLGTISLSACPFLNAGGSYSLSTDFYLNDTAGGGALIKNKMVPMSYGFDGTQDNFSNIISAESAGGSSGGGGVMVTVD